MDCAIKELAEGEVFHHVAILEGLKRTVSDWVTTLLHLYYKYLSII